MTEENESRQTERIEALIRAMTLAEKIGQLVMRSGDMAQTGPGATPLQQSQIEAGGIGALLNIWGRGRIRTLQRIAIEKTRLGVPMFFGLDVLHGHRAIFPIPLAEAGTFDEDIWRSSARLSAQEAAADGVDLTFAPMLDVSRDARWGRIAESPGEDAWLASRFAVAKVEGFQAPDATGVLQIGATAKHFVAYGAVTAGREYASVDVSERAMFEVHLPAFRAAVDAGVAAIMPALTDIAGVPMTANRTLLTDLLRDRWKFGGVFISDYGAVEQLIQHGVAGDLAEAAALALHAGLDIDMMSEAYRAGLPQALERGLIETADIDAAVRRVLRLKFRLGLFDDPYRRCGERDVAADLRLPARTPARDIAARSIVLAQRRPGVVLPIDERYARIALIGPLADAPREMLGPWSAVGEYEPFVGYLQGLREAFPKALVDHAPGVAIEGGDASGIAPALELAQRADLVVLALGESAAMSGEAGSRAQPVLPGRQADLAESVLGLGKPVVVILTCGRPLVLPRFLVDKADAIFIALFAGSEAGRAMADVLSGRVNPSARLTATWPRDVGQIPIFYGQRPTGRPEHPDDPFTTRYIDVLSTPQFPFGHGLSYTDFSFDELDVAPRVWRPGDNLAVRVRVTNTGALAGEATALCFLRDPVASIAQPVLKLRGFRKAWLEPGASAIVTFDLSADDLSFIDANFQPRLEPGGFEVFIGDSSAGDRLIKATFDVAPGDGATQGQMIA